MRVLFLSPYVPSRVRVRPYHWIRSLARLGHDVHLVALQAPGDDVAADDQLRRSCSSIDLFSLSAGRTLVNAALALPHPGTPLQLAYSHHPRAERHVAALVGRGRFDVVHIEHMRGAALACRVRGTPVVYDAVDSISALFEETVRCAPSIRARLLARLDLERSRRFEARAPFLFSRVIVTSDQEAAAFADLAGPAACGRLVVVCNGVDTDFFRPCARGTQRAVVFTGKLSYHANAAAAVRLVERIMPRVWARQPDTPVVLAGKDPPGAVRALGKDRRVRVTGFVEDMRQVLADAAVAVCPLVYGAGIQNKVLEAMASAVPTIMTSAAGRALRAAPHRDYLVCHTDEEFAAAILRLLVDEDLRRRLGAGGRAYVVAHHQWDALASLLVRVYESAQDQLLRGGGAGIAQEGA